MVKFHRTDSVICSHSSPITLRKAKIAYNFGLSECSRIKEWETPVKYSKVFIVVFLLYLLTEVCDDDREVCHKHAICNRKKKPKCKCKKPWSGDGIKNCDGMYMYNLTLDISNTDVSKCS